MEVEAVLVECYCGCVFYEQRAAMSFGWAEGLVIILLELQEEGMLLTILLLPGLTV